MAEEYLIQGSTLTAIANAIRGKTGAADPMTVDEMPAMINGIETGPSVDLSGITAVETDVLDTASFMTREGSVMQGSIPSKNSGDVLLGQNGSVVELSFSSGYYDSDVYQTLDISSTDTGLPINLVETTWMSDDFLNAFDGAVSWALQASTVFGTTIWPLGIGFTLSVTEEGSETNMIIPIIFGNVYAKAVDSDISDFGFRATAGTNSQGNIVIEAGLTDAGDGISLTKLEINGVDYASSVTNTTPVKIFTLGY